MKYLFFLILPCLILTCVVFKTYAVSTEDEASIFCYLPSMHIYIHGRVETHNNESTYYTILAKDGTITHVPVNFCVVYGDDE